MAKCLCYNRGSGPLARNRRRRSMTLSPATFDWGEGVRVDRSQHPPNSNGRALLHRVVDEMIVKDKCRSFVSARLIPAMSSKRG